MQLKVQQQRRAGFIQLYSLSQEYPSSGLTQLLLGELSVLHCMASCLTYVCAPLTWSSSCTFCLLQTTSVLESSAFISAMV